MHLFHSIFMKKTLYDRRIQVSQTEQKFSTGYQAAKLGQPSPGVIALAPSSWSG
jgi:hypothetical protein